MTSEAVRAVDFPPSAFESGGDDTGVLLGSVRRAFHSDTESVARISAIGGLNVIHHLVSSIEKNGKLVAPAGVFKANADFPNDDVPVHTVEHETRLLCECHGFPLPDGTIADMKPCSSGEDCQGTHADLRGHEESGGVILRGILSPEELSHFEKTGENPEEPRLCVLCARFSAAVLYFWCQESRNESVLQNAQINWFVNAQDSPGGYKGEYMIPLHAYAGWQCMVGPVVMNNINKLRLVRRGRVWHVDQSELVWTPKQQQPADDERQHFH